MKRGDRDLTFSLKFKHNRGDFHESDSDGSSTPRKIHRAANAFRGFMDGSAFSHHGGFEKFSTSSSSGDEGGHNLSPATPLPFNHANSSRRKGIPHRAPF